MSLLAVKDLHANVGEEDGQEILKGLNLQIQAGEVHAIMGPIGSGKATLAYVLSGRRGYTVTRGSLSLESEDLSHLEPHERAQRARGQAARARRRGGCGHGPQPARDAAAQGRRRARLAR